MPLVERSQASAPADEREIDSRRPDEAADRSIAEISFLRELCKATAQITDPELEVLDHGGWRERKTAAWLIAVSRRTRFRDKIGALLHASEGP